MRRAGSPLCERKTLRVMSDSTQRQMGVRVSSGARLVTRADTHGRGVPGDF
jgi:hypothetical protein